VHVLFITESRFDKSASGDGSTRYRCFNVAEALIESGNRATVASLSDDLTGTLSRYHVISVLRPRASRRLARLVAEARSLGIHLVADFDDLIFDVDAAAESPLVLNGFADVNRVARGFTRFNTAAGRSFPTIPVYLLSNGLSPLWLQHIDKVLQHKTESDHGVAISYLPGTRSHDADFRQIKAAVSNWLSQDSQRALRIVGELELDEQEFRESQLTREPLVPYFQLPEKIRRAHATLAPLVNNRFNEAKSHIKFLESAALGVPVVASSNTDINQHESVNGLFYANTVEQWEASINAAIEFYQDSIARDQLSDYVRNFWCAPETCKSSIRRWESVVGMQVSPTNIGHRNVLKDPQTFYSALRTVPEYYTRSGWQPEKKTNLIVFESCSVEEFGQLNPDAFAGKLTSAGSEDDQWLVLVLENSSSQLHRALEEAVRRCRPQATHIEVLYARTLADRCSLVFQCDRVIWLTAELYPEAVTWNRTLTNTEKFTVVSDRWLRKTRKFRESPLRFFADSKLAKAAGF